MPDFITLLGAEDVARAGSTIQSAADKMSMAASQIDAVFERQRFFMDAWLTRFEAVLKRDDDA